MKVLAINAGSSSVRAAVVDTKAPARGGQRILDVRVTGIGTGRAAVAVDGDKRAAAAADHEQAFEAVWRALAAAGARAEGIDAVGHRVVSGGTRLIAPVLIDRDTEAELDALSAIAPLHNPPSLAGIRAARELYDDRPQVAVFDTGFHRTIPEHARRYALPRELAERHGLVRLGFHGLSHAAVMRRTAAHLGVEPAALRIVSCHLGSGCSATAIAWGRSVETSMGATPLEGLMMGTRPGDLDPGVLIELMRAEGLSADELEDVLYRRSGLAGVAGSADMREVEARAADGDADAALAIRMFCGRVKKYIGAYAASMGGVDAVAFAGGIGEHSAAIRERCVRGLEFLGVVVDEERNRAARVGEDAPVADVSGSTARVRLLVVATDEETAIAEAVAALLGTGGLPRRIPVSISARHAHLCRSSVEALFGAGAELTPGRALGQPGQFAAEETLALIGPKGRIEGVRVVGPERGRDQVEISRSDEIHLGIDAPVRASGDLEDSAGLTLEGPAGTVELEQGVICALRHIHMHPDDAAAMGLRDRDRVEVEVGDGPRELVYEDVLVRVNPRYRLELHLDTDEANAAELSHGDMVTLRRLVCRPDDGPANGPRGGSGDGAGDGPGDESGNGSEDRSNDGSSGRSSNPPGDASSDRSRDGRRASQPG